MTTMTIKLEQEPELGLWKLVDGKMLQMFNGEIWITVSTNAKYRNRKTEGVYIVQDVVRNATNGSEGKRTVIYYDSVTHEKYARDEQGFYEKFEPIKE